MDGTIRLSPTERKMLIGLVQRGEEHRQVRRAHVLLLLAARWSVREIAHALFCSFELIATVRQGFTAGGVSAALAAESQPAPRLPAWYAVVQQWILSHTPQDFGFCRSRWSCEALALLLKEQRGLRVCGETVRRALHRLGLVWRRPRPVVGPRDPQHAAKMRRLRRLLLRLPPGEGAVFADEVQIDLNPKLGSCWMPRGEQAQVVTPGDNQRRHVAASLVVGTGRVLASLPGTRRNTDLFLAHLQDLCRRLRSWRTIHVLCDNASFHQSRRLQDWLATKQGRLKLHYLPARAPQENRVEQVFWRLHEEVTRNHRCRSMAELLTEVYDWFHERYCYTSIADYALAG